MQRINPDVWNYIYAVMDLRLVRHNLKDGKILEMPKL